jgi:hypothetical protein
MNIQDLNTKTYVIDIAATTQSETFDAAIATPCTAILYNDSDQAVFVVASKSVSPVAAVWPTSTTGKEGKVIGAKMMASFDLDVGDKHLSAIQLVAGTGNLYFSFGRGF